jgi:hypothetical protein
VVTIASIVEIAKIAVLSNWYLALSEKAKHFRVATELLRLNTKYEYCFIIREIFRFWQSLALSATLASLHVT